MPGPSATPSLDPAGARKALPNASPYQSSVQEMRAVARPSVAKPSTMRPVGGGGKESSAPMNTQQRLNRLLDGRTPSRTPGAERPVKRNLNDELQASEDSASLRAFSVCDGAGLAACISPVQDPQSSTLICFQFLWTVWTYLGHEGLCLNLDSLMA